MPEIGTSGSMSGDGKRSVAEWPKLPRPSSTLPEETSPGRGTSRGEIRDPLLSDADSILSRRLALFREEFSDLHPVVPQPRADLAPSLNARAWPWDVREWPKCMDRPALGDV